MKERFGYDDASRARDFVLDIVEDYGLHLDNIEDGVVLGSGLGAFPEDHMEDQIRIDFNDIYRYALKIDDAPEEVEGHARQLIIGALRDSDDAGLVIAQSGREHPYEGVDMKRSVFWIRVMQLLGVETLVGSNAAGILTPETLEPPALMLAHSSRDYGDDSPLKGQNDEQFGPRFPHMGDLHSEQTRDLVKKVAKKEGVDLKEGMYMRVPGPNYERAEDVYAMRDKLDRIWQKGRGQEGENRFYEKPTGVVGMSSTYELMAAQHATQSERYPAFLDGKAYISVATNYSASLGPNGFVAPSNHKEVEENARLVQEQFGRLVKGVITEIRNRV